MNKVYCIPTLANKSEVLRVLSLLFSKSYVVFRTRRINNIREFVEYQYYVENPECENWNYICIGCDSTCKRVVEGVTHSGGAALITVEDFIKLN